MHFLLSPPSCTGSLNLKIPELEGRISTLYRIGEDERLLVWIPPFCGVAPTLVLESGLPCPLLSHPGWMISGPLSEQSRSWLVQLSVLPSSGPLSRVVRGGEDGPPAPTCRAPPFPGSPDWPALSVHPPRPTDQSAPPPRSDEQAASRIAAPTLQLQLPPLSPATALTISDDAIVPDPPRGNLYQNCHLR